MRISEIGQLTCSVARTVSVVGDPWTLMIVRELFMGSRRFDELETYLGLSPRLLSARMAALTAAGIVSRRPYQTRPKRYEYQFTQKGLDLWPVIIALRAWGDLYEGDKTGKPSVILHIQCGHICEPRLACSVCQAPIDANQVQVEQSAASLKQRRALAAGGRPRGQAARRARSQ